MVILVQVVFVHQVIRCRADARMVVQMHRWSGSEVVQSRGTDRLEQMCSSAIVVQ